MQGMMEMEKHVLTIFRQSLFPLISLNFGSLPAMPLTQRSAVLNSNKSAKVNQTFPEVQHQARYLNLSLLTLYAQ